MLTNITIMLLSMLILLIIFINTMKMIGHVSMQRYHVVAIIPSSYFQ